MNIKQILENYKSLIGGTFHLHGWVTTPRVQRIMIFISLNDCSCYKCIQIVINNKLELSSEEEFKLNSLTKGACIKVTGELIESPAKGHDCEFTSTIELLEILGTVDATEYPLSKKKHGLEFIRQFPHLRCRTNIFAMVARIRNTCTYATHKYFQDNGFINVHTPLITSNDCEGSGETFTITNLLGEKLSDVPVDKESKIDYERIFLVKKTF